MGEHVIGVARCRAPHAVGKAVRIAGFCAAAALWAGGVEAAPYTFTLMGNITGSIGGQALTDDPFTWTVVANGQAPTAVAGVVPALPAISDTISLAGVGTAVATGATYVAQQTATGTLGFVNQAVDGGLTWTSPVFNSPVLTQAVAATPVSFGYTAPLATTLGSLAIASATNLVFSAIGGPPAAMPPDIVYTLSGQLSGMLGATAFADQSFTWTLTANTGALVSVPPGGAAAGLRASGDVLQIAGLGTLTPTFPFVAVGVPAQSAFVFANGGGVQGLGWTASALAAYTLGTSIGPLGVSFLTAAPIDTGSGVLTITGGTDLVFSGRVVGVSEPESLLLLGVGLLGVGLVRARRRAGSSVDTRA